jgi:hypothetical protein
VIRARFEPLLHRAEADGLLPVVSFERFSGHPFSGGYDAGEIARRLKDVFPEARVLVVIREQRSMIVSTYKQYVINGGPCSLRRFVKSPSSGSMRVPWFNLAHFEYHHLIRHYRALFGEQAVLTLAYEQFVQDPRAYVAAIAAFAGVPISDELLATLPYHARSNIAPPAAQLAVKRRGNHLAMRSELNPAPLFTSRLAKRMTRSITSLPIHRLLPKRLAASSEESLRRAAAQLVGDRYRESNRETAELTGIDLDAYGWTT